MSTRVLLPELMDDPEIEQEVHSRALRGLARINRISRAAAPLAAAVRRSIEPGSIRIVDVATGSGDVALALATRLTRVGYECEFILTDISAFALELARHRFASAGVNAEARNLDATREEIPAADLAVCTLFLHHLQPSQAERVLSAMSRAAGRMMIVSDLRRTGLGTLLARTIPRVSTTSSVVHVDAVRSARAAFSLEELAAIAQRAGLEGGRIKRTFPSRMLLQWTPPA